jgi:hypothetical protein
VTVSKAKKCEDLRFKGLMPKPIKREIVFEIVCKWVLEKDREKSGG